MTATASSQPRPAEPAVQPAPPHASGFWILTLGTLGVVYGDIGTSPLYALKESLSAAAGGRRRHPRDGVRDRVADPVGADLHRHDQVRAVHPARRQQRRGRHAHADGARAEGHGPQRARHHPARHDRRRPVLWRRHHHAGDLGALGRRGPDARQRPPSSTMSCRSAS